MRTVIGILIAILVAAVVYVILIALTGSGILALIAAVLVLLARGSRPVAGDSATASADATDADVRALLS
jgi:hypothetical protein